MTQGRTRNVSVILGALSSTTSMGCPLPENIQLECNPLLVLNVLPTRHESAAEVPSAPGGLCGTPARTTSPRRGRRGGVRLLRGCLCAALRAVSTKRRHG